MTVRRIWAAALCLVMALAVLVPITVLTDETPSSALSGSEFKAGNIISDENFYDGTAMSESEVQSFLNARVPSCSSGYVCLKNYSQSTYSRPADAMCKAYTGASNESAARIIVKVANACNISPKVLLVTLEKEQSLVTSTAPSTGRYTIAMGYACPDTAACDSQFFGFYNQVYKGAWQLKRYGNPPGTANYFTWFPVGRPGNIGFHPNAACGTSPVTIENKATAALYYYTPYQPNAAALANLYGTGDGCSAYGNRNFWRLYTGWFGSTTAVRHGSLDTATGGYKSIALTGWAVDTSKPSESTYIWVNVDGVGGPFKADKALSWFNAQFPGYGNNHGFDVTVPATPGAHEVCVYRDQSLIACRTVDVPQGIGHLDSAVGVVGGVKIGGWSVDSLRNDFSYIWVNIDGQGGAQRTNRSFAWLNTMFPGAGTGHGFDLTVWATPGRHEVCVHGPDNLIGCQTVTVPAGTGALDSAVAVNGGVQVKGWSVDGNRPASSFIWANVDGSGQAYRTNVALSWLPNYLPGFGAGNGFDVKLPARKGTHQICVHGVESLLGCKTVTVAKSADGHVDTATAVAGGIRLTGWSVDLTTPAVSYIWVNVDGAGAPYKADKALSWFDGYYPGSGPNHGFDVTIPKPPGTYQVCVHGTESLLSCHPVTVS